jgi:2-keto-3-deoxy-6-phosphogluconate aldolase
MRRKLIEQVVKRYALVTSISAGATTAHVSAGAGTGVIDRKGFLSAYFVQMHATETAGLTTDSTVFTLYQCATRSGSFTAVNTGTWTMQTYPAQSAGGTAATTAAQLIVDGQIVDDLYVDLSECERYLKVYLTPTGATTVTAMVSVTCVLGDAVNEPAT